MTIPDLQSQIDPVTWEDYGDIYKYIVVGDYLYMVGYSYDTGYAILMVWNISDITDPQLVNTLESDTYWGYYDIIHHNGCLYVTASDWDEDNPIIVFSLANPALPVSVDSIGSHGTPYYTWTIPLIVHSGNYLFSVGDSEYNCPMVIFDISVQNTITKHSEVSRPGGKWANNPVFFNDHVLVSSSGSDDLYNVSDIDNIILVTSTFTQFDWITDIYGDYAWVEEVTGSWEYYADVWNISDPTNVTFVVQYPPDTKDGEPAPYYFGAKGFKIRGSDGKAFGIYENGSSNCGVSEHNIIDPTNVILTDRDHNAIYCVGNWWGDMVFDGTSIIFWSRGTGLMIWGIPAGIQVGDTVLLIPNYGDIYDRAAIKGGAISTGDNVQLYPLKGGAKVAIKEEWSAGDKIIF